MAGDPEIGEELRQFFLYLLANGDAMQRYHDPEGREEEIGRRGFKTDAANLLRDGSLREIEQHILAVTNSPLKARPLMIVWPPM